MNFEQKLGGRRPASTYVWMLRYGNAAKQRFEYTASMLRNFRAILFVLLSLKNCESACSKDGRF